MTKKFGQDLGLSCCYRAHRDEGHCKFLHGYSLSFEITFAGKLDDKGWVIDFGHFGRLRDMLRETFDHTLCASKDDPMLPEFFKLEELGLAQVKVMEAVGAEAFAKVVFGMTQYWMLVDFDRNEVAARNLRVLRVICWERPGNSAAFTP